MAEDQSLRNDDKLALMTCFEFACTCCGKIVRGMPQFGFQAPDYYAAIPEDEREDRGSLTADLCTADGNFFIRGCLDIRVEGADEPFSYGAWVSLSEQNYKKFLDTYSDDIQSHLGPWFGWLCNMIDGYPDTLSLKTMVRLRDQGERPLIELEPTDHPLAIEQRNGITPARAAELYAFHMRGHHH